MNDLRFGGVGNRVALLKSPASPGQVFQAGQVFVVWVFLPQGPANGRIGIMAVGMSLVRNGVIRKILLEPLVFGILVGFTAALLAVGNRDL